MPVPTVPSFPRPRSSAGLLLAVSPRRRIDLSKSGGDRLIVRRKKKRVEGLHYFKWSERNTRTDGFSWGSVGLCKSFNIHGGKDIESAKMFLSTCCNVTRAYLYKTRLELERACWRDTVVVRGLIRASAELRGKCSYKADITLLGLTHSPIYLPVVRCAAAFTGPLGTFR